MLIMKDGKVGPAHLKIASSPSYTLAELKQLAAEYAAEYHNEGRLAIQLIMSAWFVWLAKREQGKED